MRMMFVLVFVSGNHVCARVSCGVVLCCVGVGVAKGNILVGWLFSNVGGPMVMCPWVRNVVCVPTW